MVKTAMADTLPRLELLDEANQSAAEVILHYLYGGQTFRVTISRADVGRIEPALPPRGQENLIRENLDALMPIIEGTRVRGEIGQWTDRTTGRTLPLIEISHAELDQAIKRHQVTYDAVIGAESLSTVSAPVASTSPSFAYAPDHSDARSVSMTNPSFLDPIGPPNTPLPLRGPPKGQDKRRSNGRAGTSGRSTTVTIRDRAGAISLSRALIEVFQEAVDYVPARHHNQSKPVLWVDNERYLSEIQEIVSQLQKIVALLDTQKTNRVKAAPIRKMTGRFGQFFNSYQSTLGHSLAVLTTGTIARGFIISASYRTKLLNSCPS